MKTTDRKVQITVKRPNGQIEKILNDNLAFATSKQIQDKVIKATKEAGKGDILSFELVEIEREMTASEAKHAARAANQDAYDAMQRKIMEH